MQGGAGASDRARSPIQLRRQFCPAMKIGLIPRKKPVVYTTGFNFLNLAAQIKRFE